MKQLDPILPASVAANAPRPIAAGAGVWIRTAAADDLDNLIEHFRQLSLSSRYNRFMGAVGNLSRVASDCLICGKADGFTLVAELKQGARVAIVGEASYAFDRGHQRGEFAISVADRWRRHGLGSALLCAVQLRAISLGRFRLFGESLKTNAEMQGLARKAGFAVSRSLDWRAVGFGKTLAG
jgi:GNAT superfamily N-acetyltransferase